MVSLPSFNQCFPYKHDKFLSLHRNVYTRRMWMKPMYYWRLLNVDFKVWFSRLKFPVSFIIINLLTWHLKVQRNIIITALLFKVNLNSNKTILSHIVYFNAIHLCHQTHIYVLFSCIILFNGSIHIDAKVSFLIRIVKTKKTAPSFCTCSFYIQ